MQVISQIGAIQSVSDTGVACVKYRGGNKISVPTDALTKVGYVNNCTLHVLNMKTGECL